MQSKNWGGKREGAGRKLGANVRISLSIPREIWEDLGRQAEVQDLSIQQLVIKILKEGVAQ